MTTNPTHRDDRKREASEALSALERRAAEMGVAPFDAGEWLAESDAGQSSEEVTREVDEFLSLVREQRDAPSRRDVN